MSDQDMSHQSSSVEGVGHRANTPLVGCSRTRQKGAVGEISGWK